AKTSLASALEVMSFGRGSYSCGSVPGERIWCTDTASPPTLRTRSATGAVVATTASFSPAPAPALAVDASSEDPQPARPSPASTRTAVSSAGLRRRDDGRRAAAWIRVLMVNDT